MRLLSFSVENYKSFYERQSVTFIENEQNATAFYGANSAGKSNLFSALKFYCDFILHSTDFHRNAVLGNNYFQYVKNGAMEPSSFSAEFKNQGTQFRYSFSINRIGKVSSEKLEFASIKLLKNELKYETVFSRKSMVNNNRYIEHGFGSALLNETRPDSLVLTRAYAANNKIAKRVFECIESINLYNFNSFGMTAEKVANNSELKGNVLRFLKMADLYIQDFHVEEIKTSYGGDSLENILSKEVADLYRRALYKVSTVHYVYDENDVVVGTRDMMLNENESNGTKQLFEYAYPVIEALNEGKVLYIDELETNLHPRECAFIVELFNNIAGENKQKGQLIINTHDMTLMDLLGKDNVYLLGKNRHEATVISKISGVRSDDKNLAKKYYAGLFGATPRIMGY